MSARRRIRTIAASSSGFEDEHLRARQQRRVDLEGRVLGGRADEHDVAGFDARQKGVLLRLVEAMDLVDEDDRAAAEPAAAVLGRGHDVLDFLDAREHGAEGDELRVGEVGDEARERRLAGARRSPEDDRLQQVALDRLAQRPARADRARSWPSTSSSVRGRIRSASGTVRGSIGRSGSSKSDMQNRELAIANWAIDYRPLSMAAHALPSCLVDEKRGRDGDVQRFHAPCSSELRFSHRPAQASEHRGRRLPADDEGDAWPKRRVVHRHAAVRHSGMQRQSSLREALSTCSPNPARGRPAAETCCPCGAQALSSPTDRRCPEQQHAGRASGFRRANDGAGIAGILNIDGDDDQGGRRREQRAKRGARRCARERRRRTACAPARSRSSPPPSP